MTIAYDHILPAVLMICLLWLTLIACLHLLPRALATFAHRSATWLWWLIMALSFAVIAPEDLLLQGWGLGWGLGWEKGDGGGSGYSLLPAVTLAAALASSAGLKAWWWPLLLGVIPAALIGYQADYLPAPAIAGAIVIAIACTGVAAAIAYRRVPTAVLRPTAVAIWIVLGIAAWQLGAPVIFAIALVSISGLLACAVILGHGKARLGHLLITVPVIAAVEWLLFGY